MAWSGSSVSRWGNQRYRLMPAGLATRVQSGDDGRRERQSPAHDQTGVPVEKGRRWRSFASPSRRPAPGSLAKVALWSFIGGARKADSQKLAHIALTFTSSPTSTNSPLQYNNKLRLRPGSSSLLLLLLSLIPSHLLVVVLLSNHGTDWDGKTDAQKRTPYFLEPPRPHRLVTAPTLLDTLARHPAASIAVQMSGRA
jgi:hypothetical protein